MPVQTVQAVPSSSVQIEMDSKPKQARIVRAVGPNDFGGQQEYPGQPDGRLLPITLVGELAGIAERRQSVCGPRPN